MSKRGIELIEKQPEKVVELIEELSEDVKKAAWMLGINDTGTFGVAA